MPRIPIYQQQVTVSQSPGTPTADRAMRYAGTGAAAIGAGLEKLAAGMEKQAEVDFQLEKDRIETEGRTWFAKASSEADLAMAEHANELKNSVEPGARGFAQKYLSDFDKYQGESLKAAPSQYARSLMQAHLAQTRELYGKQVMAFEDGERIRYDGQQFEEGVDTSAKLVMANPDLWERELGKWGGVANGAAASPEQRAARKEAARQKIVWAAGVANIDRNAAQLVVQQAPAQKTPAPGVSPDDQRRLAGVKFTPEQDAALARVSSGDTQKQAFLRTVLTIENRGFGAVRSDAVSPAGSMGPFQFIGATGKQYGLQSDADRKDFGKSAAAASKYYDDLNKRYGGNLAAMIAEYNGGTRAAQAVMDGKEPPQKETREYVAMARHLLGGETAAPGAETVAPAQVAEVVGPAWNLMTFQEQQRLTQYAEQKGREYKTQKLASDFIDVAKTVVDGAALLPGDMVDLPGAKRDAAAMVASRGITLDAAQTLQLENYVEKVAADRERAVKVQTEARVAGVFDLLEQNGGDYQATVRANPWIASAPAEVRARVNNFAGQVATGATRATDWQAYTMLVDNPAVLRGTNLDAMRDKFNASEFAQLKKMQVDLQNGQPEQNVLDTGTLLKRLLDEAGYKRNDEVQGRFYSLLQQAVDQELEATGKKKLPQDRVKELAADLLLKDVTSNGWLFDSKETAARIEVPDSERVKIEAALVSQGLPINDYNVLQAYRAKLRRSTTPRPPQQNSDLVNQIPR